MRDLSGTLLLYYLRVASTSLEPVRSSADDDYSDLKAALKKHVLRLERQPYRTNDIGSTADSPSILRCGFTDSADRGRPSASSLINIIRTMLRTLERSSEFPTGSPALQRLREAVIEIIVELEPAAKKEPRFELRTGPDLYSRKLG